MEILEGHHQQWTAQLAGLSGDFRAANTGNLGDARQQLIAPGVVTRQCHYLSVLFYPFRELTPIRTRSMARAAKSRVSGFCSKTGRVQSSGCPVREPRARPCVFTSSAMWPILPCTRFLHRRRWRRSSRLPRRWPGLPSFPDGALRM